MSGDFGLVLRRGLFLNRFAAAAPQASRAAHEVRPPPPAVRARYGAARHQDTPKGKSLTNPMIKPAGLLRN
jgi:hypothetical protein